MSFASSITERYPMIARARLLVVRMVLLLLRLIAKAALSQSKATIIGIAGSIGKSSTRNAIASVLAADGETITVSGNSETGIPLGLVGLFPTDYSAIDWVRMLVSSLFRLRYLRNAKYIVVEMGIDDPYPPKNMEYLLSILEPDIGIITYESAAHTVQFEKLIGTRSFPTEEKKLSFLVDSITYEDGKMLLTARCHFGIINADVEPLRNWRETLPKSRLSSISTYGSKTTDDCQYMDYAVSTHGTTFSYHLADTKEIVSLTFSRYALPRELAGIFAPVLLLCQKLGIPIATAKTALAADFRPPKGRESIFEGTVGRTIIDSSYNASRPSVIAMLELLSILKTQTKRPTVAVLADMLELGNSAKLEHEKVANALTDEVDTLLCVGSLTKKYILPYLDKQKKDKPATTEWFATSTALHQYLEESLPENAIVLFKGSQGNLWLEELIKPLLKNRSDVNRLCRQNAFWKKVKKKAGRWVDAH